MGPNVAVMEENPKLEHAPDFDGEGSLERSTAESLGTAPLMMAADEIATCPDICLPLPGRRSLTTSATARTFRSYDQDPVRRPIVPLV